MRSNRLKREQTDFEIRLNSFINFCYKLRKTEGDSEIFHNLKRYDACLGICHNNDDVEETHVPLYSDLIDELLELEEDDLLQGKWLKKKNWNIVYVSKKGKKQSPISLNLSDLFSICSKDKKEAFLYYLYDVLRYAADTRKQRLYFKRFVEMLDEEESESETSSDDGKPSFDKMINEVGGVINKKNINSIMQRVTKMLQGVDMAQMQGLVSEVTNKPVTQDSIKEATTKAMEILAIPDGDDDEKE